MEINNSVKNEFKRHLLTFIHQRRFLVEKAKAYGYFIATFDDNQYFDENAHKISLALSLRGITQLNVFEMSDTSQRDPFSLQIDVTKEGIEGMSDWLKYPQFSHDCLLFDDALKVMIYRPDMCENSYFCGDAVFINYLTSQELSPHFNQI
jgi:hypothetical protein